MKRVFLALGITLLLVAIPAGIALSNPDAGWNKYTGNPIMFYGPPAGWDDYNIYSTDVMFWDKNDADPSNDEYYMWYSGTSYNMNGKDIGLARSSDGITWTKYTGNPVLRDGSFGYWDYERINAPTVLYDEQEQKWKMWYAGYAAYFGGFGIGYATSTDGINWQKYDGGDDRPGLVFESSGVSEFFDGYSVLSPEVLKINGAYYMWYAGNGGMISSNQIGYATSSDGIHWHRYPSDDNPQPVLPIGAPGAWDEGETVSPSIIDINGTLHMWYQGSNAEKTITGIGHATSVDGGITWTRDPANPLIVGSSEGTWDAERIFYPTVVMNADGELFMWYHARRKNVDTSPFKLGVAFWDVNFVPTPRPTPRPGDTPTPEPRDPDFVFLPAVRSSPPR